MNKLIRFIQLYFRGLLRSFFFLFAISIVIVFLPREGKFKYEFQKGKAWMHEDLISSFDFPIYKTEAELFEERNVLLKNFSPIFKTDTSQFDIISAQ